MINTRFLGKLFDLEIKKKHKIRLLSVPTKEYSKWYRIHTEHTKNFQINFALKKSIGTKQSYIVGDWQSKLSSHLDSRKVTDN